MKVKVQQIVVKEGGNMFPDVVPIHQENVASTIDDVMKRFVNGELHLDPETQASPIGSTGKKLVG